MPLSDLSIRLEMPGDAPAIDMICDRAFGPGASTRAAAWLREGVDHCPDLSFVALLDAGPVGTVRLTPVRWGAARVLMLGPLAVDPLHKGRGVGRALMGRVMDEARARAGRDISAERVVILVGDLAYYAPFGFERIAPTRIKLPRPADPMRILACDLAAGASAACMGEVTRAL